MSDLQMPQAEVNARMQPWGEAELRRFGFRLGLFQRRGMAEETAETLADRLALRDQEKDDRRVCVECANLQQSGHCFAAQQGAIKHQPIRGLLWRCESFEWAKP